MIDAVALRDALWIVDLLAERWAHALVQFLWQGSAVAAVYYLISFVIAPNSANLRYTVGVFCLVIMASLLVLTGVLSECFLRRVTDHTRRHRTCGSLKDRTQRTYNDPAGDDSRIAPKE